MKQSLLVCCTIISMTLLCAGCVNENNKIVKSDNCCTSHCERKNTMTPLQTPSGVQYEIITEGSGATPTKGKPVTVHYTGWLQNPDKTLGTKFDSSVDRGQAFSFVIGVGQVIKGWDEGVATMKVGEKRRLTIPSNLGYGAQGAGRIIPPHATLIFDVELLSV